MKFKVIVKLPGHAVARGMRAKEILLYCAPSCLPVGRDPAYPAIGGTGYLPAKLSQANIKLLVDQKDPTMVTTNNRNEVLLHKEPKSFKTGHSYIVEKPLWKGSCSPFHLSLH